jgi:hypothetical protein
MAAQSMGGSVGGALARISVQFTAAEDVSAGDEEAPAVAVVTVVVGLAVVVVTVVGVTRLARERGDGGGAEVFVAVCKRTGVRS